MKKSIKNNTRQNFGWILVAAGVILFAAGLVIRSYFPGTLADTRLVEGLGILLAGWGLVPMARAISAKRNPAEARRYELADSDERAVAIRNQAGFTAFIISNVLTAILLVVYSGMTRGQAGFDPLWWALAAVVVVPILAFIVAVSRNNQA